MKLFIGGSWREVASAQAYIGGTWRRITRKMVYASGAWRTAVSFAAPLSISAPPASNSIRSPGAPSVGANTTATPVGGVAPYTYLWAVESGSLPAPSLSNTNMATVTALQGSVGPGSVYEGYLRVTVTDATAATAFALVEYRFANRYGDIGEPF